MTPEWCNFIRICDEWQIGLFRVIFDAMLHTAAYDTIHHSLIKEIQTCERLSACNLRPIVLKNSHLNYRFLLQTLKAICNSQSAKGFLVEFWKVAVSQRCFSRYDHVDVWCCIPVAFHVYSRLWSTLYTRTKFTNSASR